MLDTFKELRILKVVSPKHQEQGVAPMVATMNSTFQEVTYPQNRSILLPLFLLHATGVYFL